MPKWLTSLISTTVVLIAILLLLPPLLGLLAENKCRQMVATINATTPLSAKIIDYHRGWFTANATAQLSLDKLELPQQELYQLLITANITHGPIFMDWQKFKFVQAMINADLKLTTTQNKWLQREAKTTTVAKIKIRFKPSGDTDYTLDSLPFAHHYQDHTINWHGLNIRSIFTPLYNQVKSTINLAGVEIKTKNFTLRLGEVTSRYHGIKTANNIWLGERHLQLASFALTNANHRTLAFDNLNIHNLTRAGEQDLAAHATTITTIDNLNINGAAYTQNKLNIEINNFNQSLLATLQQQLISSKVIVSPASTLFSALTTMLATGNEINIKQLDTSTPWGKLCIAISMAFPQQAPNSNLFATLANSTIHAAIKTEPALALHLLEKFYQNIPTPPHNPTTQAALILKEWQQSGKLLTSHEDPYLHVTFDYKDNQPFINNQQLIITTKP